MFHPCLPPHMISLTLALSLLLLLLPALFMQVGECVGTWWRPNFDTVFYPYLPPHITRPKELKKLFVVPLLERTCFSVRACFLDFWRC